LLAVALSGCSKVEADAESDWMLGTFSARYPGDSTIGLASVGHYEFLEDGTLKEVAVVGCQANQEEPVREYKWRRDGDQRVIVDVPPPDNEVFQSWIIIPGEDCNSVQVHMIQDDEVEATITLWRGAVCLWELPPCEAGSCPSCVTDWCDEPPPACEE
jgi:hypothetical protein